MDTCKLTYRCVIRFAILPANLPELVLSAAAHQQVDVSRFCTQFNRKYITDTILCHLQLCLSTSVIYVIYVADDIHIPQTTVTLKITEIVKVGLCFSLPVSVQPCRVPRQDPRYACVFFSLKL